MGLKDEKIAVIGSNSFSGAHLVDSALSEGAEVIGISRSPELHPVFLPYQKNGSKSFRFYQFDLNHDVESILSTLKNFQPHYVFHFAAQGMVAESWQAPDQWYMTNLVSAVKLHEGLRRFDFLKKFIQISTPEVYGSCEGNVKENIHYDPSTPYAVSKAAVDMSLMSYFHAYGFPVSFTRAANVYGPFQQLYRIIPKAILCFLTKRKLPLHGGGHSERSFIHIKDVVDGSLRVARDDDAGDIYHFSSEENISIRHLVELIAEQVGVSFEENVLITEDRLGKDNAYSLDSSKAMVKLGWADRIRLEQGIDETINWVKDNFTTLIKMPDFYIHKP